MTRINSAIRVRLLTDEHLLAEHREIKRLPSVFSKCKSLQNIPKTFRLGSGHVLFFLDKFAFTLRRFREINTECLRRGFDVDDYSDNWLTVPPRLFNDYVPTAEEQMMLIERIKIRILDSSKEYFHFEGRRISKVDAVALLQKID